MNDKRLMIRLIDVALIILLGFVAISRLKTDYIDLPAPGNAKQSPNRIHSADLHVYRSRFVIMDRGQRRRIRNLQTLERELVRSKRFYRRQGAKLVMNIQPHKSSIMQNLIDVLDICQRNKIEKNLAYDRLN